MRIFKEISISETDANTKVYQSAWKRMNENVRLFSIIAYDIHVANMQFSSNIMPLDNNIMPHTEKPRSVFDIFVCTSRAQFTVEAFN